MNVHRPARRFAPRVLIAGLLAAVLLVPGTRAQDRPLREAYLTPPDAIQEEVMAPRHRNVELDNVNPTGEYFLNETETGLLPLRRYARPHHNLAGLEIDPQANRARWMSTSSTNGLELIDPQTGAARSIDTPDDARFTSAEWSPDGAKLAYFAHFDDATHLYVADLESGESRRVTNRPALPTLASAIEWAGDGDHLFVVLTPANFGAEPEKPAVPTTPEVRKTMEEENRLRTYQSLLKGPYQASLLEHYVTGQLARIDVESGDMTPVGKPDMISDFDPSPSGEHVRVETMEKPFSYIVPFYDFPSADEIWTVDGEVLATLETAALDAGIPDSNEVEDFGRSDIEWRPDGEGLSFILDPDHEEDDEDDGEEESEDATEEDDEETMYEVVRWEPPFGEDDQTTIYETDTEPSSVDYTEDGDLLFITEDENDEEHVYAVDPDDPDETHTIYRHEEDDFYDDPGNLEMTTGSLGVDVVRTSPDGERVYLSGTQRYENYAEEAPRPFLDAVEIESGDTERLFQSSEDMYENVNAILDEEVTQLVVERESAETIPDSWRFDLDSEEYTKLTDNQDYNEAVTGAQRDRFKVERSDGFEFWVEVTVPREWSGDPLPGLIWHYPTEYDDQEDYNEGARYHNKNSFPGVYDRSTEILVKEGYAVIDADWPIAGQRGSSNDNFVWSIVQNATVVIDSAEARGYIDRDRMAIGGHSYGAFGTANAMIHTSFFRAGIAGDGNYNRTLTPMGFQREPADLWRGQDRYLQMSPIFWADRIDGALLMYHGAEDQNSGTWPTNSRRMFHAMNGIGKTAAMYMYPYEDHGPDAEETVLDLWRRWVDWLDHYVKNKGEPVPEVELGTPAEE